MARMVDIMAAVSLLQQSAYGTALTDTNISTAMPFVGTDFLKESYEKKDDTEVQKGHEWAEGDSVALTCDVSGSRKIDGDSTAVGWIAAMACGDCTSALADGATAAYQHEILPLDAKVSKQLPVTSIIEDQGEFKKLYRDICIPEFSISGALKKQLEVTFQLQGSGFWETSTKVMPNLQPVSYLRCGNVKFERDATDIAPQLRSFQFDYKNEMKLDDGYRFGGPYLVVTHSTETMNYQVRSKCEFKKRTVGLKFKVDYTDTLYKEMQVGLVKPITITSEGDEIETGHNHGLNIFLPACEIKKADIVDDDGDQCLDCEVLAKYDRTEGFIVKIMVINDTQTYLALPV